MWPATFRPTLLGGNIEERVHDIGVVASAAIHRVGAAAAVERVVAAAADQDVVAAAPGQNVGGGVAGDAVGQDVAGAVDRVSPDQGQVLDVGGERMADA